MAESNRQRRFFPDAFKLEAVAAVRSGRSVTAVAAELGLPDRLVRAWLSWAEGRRAAGSGAPAPRRIWYALASWPSPSRTCCASGALTSTAPKLP